MSKPVVTFSGQPIEVGMTIKYAKHGASPRVLMALEDDGVTIGFNNARHVLEPYAKGVVLDVIPGDGGHRFSAPAGIKADFSGRIGYVRADYVEVC
jgi:hypothetical protein